MRLGKQTSQAGITFCQQLITHRKSYSLPFLWTLLFILFSYNSHAATPPASFVPSLTYLLLDSITTTPLPDYKDGPHVVFDAAYLPSNPIGSDNNERGTFRVKCDFSHLNYDDAIVSPGVQNAMHLHSYFGNTATNYQTTTPSALRAASISSTCQGGPLNKTAYWIPSMVHPLYQKAGSRTDANRGFLIVDNKPVPQTDAAGKALYAVVKPKGHFPTDINGVVDTNNPNNGAPDLYYKFNGFGIIPGESTARTTNVLPAGLRMIVGDPFSNTDPGVPWWARNYRWSCHDSGREFGSGSTFFTSIPACRLDNSDVAGVEIDHVLLNIFFPTCWNGKDLDAPDHRSHMAFSQAHSNWPTPLGQFCPGEETADPNDDWVRLPIISYNINYPITWLNATPQVNPATGEVVRDGSGNLILGSSGWFLSSDRYTTYGKLQDSNHNTPSALALPGGLSAHADWFMAWDDRVMADFVQHCINEERHCANGELGNGYRLIYDNLITDPNQNPLLDMSKNSREVINQGHGAWPLPP